MNRLFVTSAMLVLACCQTRFAHAQVTGNGNSGFVPVWTDSKALGDSAIFSKGAFTGFGTKNPTARLDVLGGYDAPGIHALGFTPQPGSDRSGTDGIDAKGGDASADSGVAFGGAGVVGIGGAGSLMPNGGPGGYFVGGKGGGGDGIVVSCPSQCNAAYFEGNVVVTGTLTAATKNFRIDNPVDPANKYLVHAAVESSEMKNIYDGTIVLDAHGAATVQLPAWFEAENENFRYQLTAIGGPAPGLYIARKVAGNRFAIAGGGPGLEVSWQITGARHDAFARANPLVIEPAKMAAERGTFVHPELFGADASHGTLARRELSWAGIVR